jgi:hypothetical protein
MVDVFDVLVSDLWIIISLYILDAQPQPQP